MVNFEELLQGSGKLGPHLGQEDVGDRSPRLANSGTKTGWQLKIVSNRGSLQIWGAPELNKEQNESKQ